MPAVSETIVREFFELHEFLVRQSRKFVGQARGEAEEEDVDFFVLNPHPLPREGALSFVLDSSDLLAVERAIVVVKGWHSETFSSGVLAQHGSALFRFAEPALAQQSARAFGKDRTALKILVVPALPRAAKALEESIAFLRSKGVDAVILFRAILADLVRDCDVNRNYQKSDLLQTIRILKRYDLLRDPQLELFKAKTPRRKAG